ncbi:NAD-dependent epimerase/dehydratase family protein [Candidatus Micrarchaeota archaeon]|nr:NAD-dependent epimerase/dehydratase family protein [Candidatus Micrarchaeota archaeon]
MIITCKIVYIAFPPHNFPVKTYITGATGRLGHSVLEQINAIPLVRKKSGLAKEVLTDFSEHSLKKILKGTTHIVHLAGSVKTWDRNALEQANVELTRCIVNASPENCHIVFASSISVYGKKLAEIPADEETPTSPDSDYARTKLEAEQLVKQKKKHTILRIGTLYGPQFQDYFNVLRMIEKGKMKIFGDGSNRISFIHSEDCAAVFPKALKKTGTYVLAGPPATQRQIYTYAARALGVIPPNSTLPVWAGMLLARIQELRGSPRLTREHISILSADRVFDYSKAQQELGFSPRPIKRGIEEMVSEYLGRKTQNK